MADERANVLLVEDDEILASVISELLAGVANTHWAPHAEEALRLLPQTPWDLVIADIELPGMSGIELLTHVKSAQPKVATLIVSGRTSFDDAIAAIRAGADDYLTKPFDRGGLVDKASELIAATRQRKAKDHDVVLAVGAHPDDVEIGVGGILLRHAAMGHTVVVHTVTGGEEGGEVAKRARESEVAADILGATLYHTDLTDTSVSDGGVTIGAIKGVIDEIHPTIVYTHTSRDVHQDHRNVHHATLVAARGIPRVYCYQAPSTTVEYHPTRFVTIDDFLDRKLEAIRAYATQTAIRGYLDEELLRATARYWARFTQARYVEPLEVVREADVGDATPVAVPATDAAGDPLGG
jgi:LmbE family N-acetylglucosaminyl deacetylase